MTGTDVPSVAEFDSQADFELTQDRVAKSRSAGNIGIRNDSDTELQAFRLEQVEFHLAEHSAKAFAGLEKIRVQSPDRFDALRRVYRRWLQEHLKCDSKTSPGHLLYRTLADEVCQRVMGYLTQVTLVTKPGVMYAEIFVNDCESSPLGDSANDRLLAVARGERLGLQIPLALSEGLRFYEPAALIVVDERGYPDDPLHLLVEPGVTECDRQIDTVIRARWLPAVNRIGCFGRWSFLRLEGDETRQASALQQHLDRLTRPESPWDYL